MLQTARPRRPVTLARRAPTSAPIAKARGRGPLPPHRRGIRETAGRASRRPPGLQRKFDRLGGVSLVLFPVDALPEEVGWRGDWDRRCENVKRWLRNVLGIEDGRCNPSARDPDNRDEDQSDRGTTLRLRAYEEQHLRDLLERVREGFAMLDAGHLDTFELDALIVRYTNAAEQLRRFCGSTSAERSHAVRRLASLRQRGEEPDWWEAWRTPCPPGTDWLLSQG